MLPSSDGAHPRSSALSRWTRQPSAVWDTIGLLARLLVGIVWIVAGYLKAADPNQTILAVRAYQLLPEVLVWPVAAVLPYLEIAAGLLLIIGLATRLASVLSILMYIAFLIGIISAAARGLSIDCGCFGSGGQTDDPAYTAEILRDFGLLIVSVYLLIRPRSYLAVDSLGQHAGDDADDGDDEDDEGADDEGAAVVTADSDPAGEGPAERAADPVTADRASVPGADARQAD